MATFEQDRFGFGFRFGLGLGLGSVCTMKGERCMTWAMRVTKKVCPEAKSATGSTPASSRRPSWPLVRYMGSRFLRVSSPCPPPRRVWAKSAWSHAVGDLKQASRQSCTKSSAVCRMKMYLRVQGRRRWDGEGGGGGCGGGGESGGSGGGGKERWWRRWWR